MATKILKNASQHLFVAVLFAVASRLPASALSIDEQYPQLTMKMRAFGVKQAAAADIGSDSQAIAECMTSAGLMGIPDADLAVMEHFTETGQPLAEARKVFAKWMGPSIIHGQPQYPSSSPYNTEDSATHYADGTPRDLEAERTVSGRVNENARAICPSLLEKYPQMFRY